MSWPTEVSQKIDHLLVVDGVCLVKIYIFWYLQSQVVRFEVEQFFLMLVEGW